MSEDKKPAPRAACVIPNCGLERKSRGLCTHHYSIASGRVKAKTGTWQQFEIWGVALPPGKGADGLSAKQFDEAIAKGQQKIAKS